MNRDEELKHIRQELHWLGLHEFPEKEVADRIKTDLDKIKLAGIMTFSQYGIQQNMDYTILLKKYERPNLYHPYIYQATLNDEPGKTRVFSVSEETFFTLSDAFNLLNGRAVQKKELNRQERKTQNVWHQLDFKNKDVHGNYTIENFRFTDQGYDLGTLLQKYPIKELMNPDDRNKLLLSLRAGNAEPVTLLKDGQEVKGFAQATPKEKTVDVYTVPVGEILRFKLSGKINTDNLLWEKPTLPDSKAKRKGLSH